MAITLNEIIDLLDAAVSVFDKTTVLQKQLGRYCILKVFFFSGTTLSVVFVPQNHNPCTL